MGSRSARRVSGLTLAGALTLPLAFVLGSEAEAGGWGPCLQRDDLCDYYLNVTTRQGQARLNVDETCSGVWRHAWQRPDARRTIEQWLDGRADEGLGTLCIPLAPEVDEIRVTAIGGHCGYPDGEASLLGPGLTLRAGDRTADPATLAGCHAGIGGQGFGGQGFGGVALDFADGYGFGDSYATGYFYGVYDGFAGDKVGQTGASVWQISRFNTYHYRVVILAKGSTDWRADFPEEDRK